MENEVTYTVHVHLTETGEPLTFHDITKVGGHSDRITLWGDDPQTPVAAFNKYSYYTTEEEEV